MWTALANPSIRRLEIGGDVTLTESGGTTELVLRQSGGHLTDEQYQEAKEGTAGFLDALAEVVAAL